MADLVVSTEPIDQRDREAFWRHALADTFAPVDLEGWGERADSKAEMSGTRRGRLLFAQLEATPHVHRRTPRLIRQADAMFFQIAALTKGTATLRQEEREATLTPGDWVAYENSRPFTWSFAEPWAVTVISIPADAVRLTDPERRSVCARRLSGRHGLSGVVARHLLDLANHASEIPIEQSERVLAQASDLAITLFASAANAEYADARQRTLLDRLKGYIREHFREPGLGPDEIAAAAHISTRYLHKLFQGEHETVALYLQGVRLESARAELLDPRHSGRSVASVAYGCGFGDISGFNRAFKAAYGVTPGELRHPARRAASLAGEPAQLVGSHSSGERET